ncbi:ArnT family glycosyltransferase [Nocardia sp. alder85J]|uniref:ArnT family glycosyltransferase n=1 Tax=Nocardia sp. alder85J TaxID=2862949 RepID=UPI001CD5672B|nr:glycosyltransferase family 39 protein [Nocardia sp. alder85J]MCX4092234.1 glycosyltransferase family 39 protein [Nocardia sp. alder85J]
MSAETLSRLDPSADRPPFAWWGVLAVAGGFAVLLGVAAAKYEFFGDELYFLAAGRRLALAYPDQGPLAPAIAHLCDLLDPGSPLAIRIPSLLMMAAASILAAASAREFGAGPRVQILAAAAYSSSPLAFNHGQLATLTFDIPLQAAIVWLLIRWVRTRQDRLLLAAGVAAALAFQAKWMVPAVWAFLGIGVLLLGPRAMLHRPALWLASLILLVAMIPGVLWQSRHGWVESRMTAVIAAEQYAAHTGPATCALQIALQCGVLGGVLSLAGLWGLVRSEALRPYRFALVAGLLLLATVLIENGRSYYIAGFVPALLGAGAFVLGRVDARRWVRALFAGLAVVSAAALTVAVMVLPLPQHRIAQPVTSQWEYGQRVSLYGQGAGFTRSTAAVHDALAALPEAERRDAVVAAGSYVEASALEEYGRSYGLPAVYSPNRGYGYFGPPPDSARTIVYVAVDGVGDRAFLDRFASSTPVARLDEPLGLPGLERLVTVYVCRDPLRPWAEVWPSLMTLTFPTGL